MDATSRGIRAALFGLMVNGTLAGGKLVAGVTGNSYALIADAVESSLDIFSSLIVWRGLRITARPPDRTHPYGYGKAEAIAAAAVSLMLLGAAVGIGVAAVQEILTPHHAPAPFTLIVLVGVVAVKEGLFRRVFRVGTETGSTAVKADAGTTGVTRSPRQRPSSASPSPSGAAPAGSRPTTGRRWVLLGSSRSTATASSAPH